MKRKKSLLIILLVLSLFIVGCSNEAGIEGSNLGENNILSGTYTGEGEGYGGKIELLGTIDSTGKLIELVLENSNETSNIGGEAAPELIENILKSQSLEVDTISGATRTSEAIIEATEDILKQGKIDLALWKSEKERGKDEEITVDVAIIGGGASGTTAALKAIDGGANVLMVERTGSVGGVSKGWAGGPFAIETEIQKEAGYDLKKEDALQTMIDYSHFISYAPLQQNIIYRSSEMISWLEGHGLEFYANPETPQLSHKDDPMKWQNYHWYSTFGTDEEVIDILHKELNDSGLDLRLNTTAKNLITDDSGSVIGFVAEKEDGSKLTVNAKSVVVGTGGFGNNKELMEESFHTPYISGMGENFGDGIKMAWDVGAAPWDIQSALLHGSGMVAPINPGKIDLGSSPLNQILRSPLLWIDKSGNRFCNEEAVYDTAYTSNVGYSVGGQYFIIVDAETLNSYTKGETLVMDPAVGGPNMEKADFIELAEEGVKQGNIFKGENISELSEAIGAEEDKLTLNIKQYNELIDLKEDPFGKSKENLKFKVENGPFYAIKMQITNLGTTGGVRVSEKLEATDIDLQPIRGLYIVGNDAAGYYGNTTAYPPYEGLATGFALTSGMIGGESAAEYAIKK